MHICLSHRILRCWRPARRALLAALLITGAAILPAGAARSASAKTVVTLWSWSPVPSTMKKMILAFEAKHPDIAVQYTNYNYSPQYLTALAAGASSGHLPDLIGLQPGSFTQQYRPYLQPLQSYAQATWGPGWKSKFYKVAIDQLTLGNPAGDSNIYDFPEETQVINIWYNTQLFSSMGLSIPKTFDQLVNAAHTLASHGIAPMYQGAADDWQNVNVFLMLAAQTAPGQVYTAEAGKTKWTSPGLIKALDAWKSLFTQNVFQVGALSNHSYPDGVNLFTAGRVGMMALGSWWLQEWRYPPPLPSLVQNWNFNDFYFPALTPGGKPSPAIGGVDVAMGMTKNARNKQAAWEVIKEWCTGVGEQQALNDLNDLPAFKGFAPTITIPAAIKASYNRYLGVLDQAQNQRIGDPRIENALHDALSGVAAGNITSQAALQKVQSVTDTVVGHH
jgi:raffinose/stachyose/melibiose transport system substrate-binding protein